MRKANIKIAPEVLPSAIGVLYDHGLRCVGSLDSGCNLDGTVTLAFEGECLPIECDSRGRAGCRVPGVAVEFTVEAYGSQRITRVSAFRLVPSAEMAEAA